MIHIFTPRRSAGARAIVDGLREAGLPARKIGTASRLVQPGDVVVGWGSAVLGNAARDVLVLNPDGPMPKYGELTTLAEAGVPAVEVSRTRREGWLPRRNNHQGGTDLLHPGRADYYVKKVDTIREYRIHIFTLPGQEPVSIRAGMKVHREGFTAPHPWIRSYDGGWRLSYGEWWRETLLQRTRDTAKRAVKALGLDFGAVDIGTTPDGRDVVFEVNRAPGLEGGTIDAYVQKIAAVWRGREGVRVNARENNRRQEYFDANGRRRR